MRHVSWHHRRLEANHTAPYALWIMNHCLLLLRLRWKTRLYQGSLRAKAPRVHVFTVFAIINTGRQCESAVHLRIKNLFESSRLHRFHRRDASECCYGPVMCSTPTFTLVLWSELNLVSKFRRGYGVTEYKKSPFSINKSWKQCKMGTWTVWTVMHVTVCCSDRPCDVCATMTWLQVVRHSETPRGYMLHGGRDICSVCLVCHATYAALWQFLHCFS